MSDFDRLKKLNPDEVFKTTFIPPKVFKKLVQKDFATLGNKTKVLGLIKIIEDRFGLELTELKESADEYFQTHKASQDPPTSLAQEPKRSNRALWILPLLLIIIGGGLYFWRMNSIATIEQIPKTEQKSFLISEEKPQEKKALPQPIKEQNSSEENLTKFVDDNASKKETNTTQQLSSEEVVSLPQIVIIPKKKLWVGIWYLDNHKRKNYITTNPIEINTSRDQLIMTGHGLFQVAIDGNVTDFKARGKVRFIYRAGELEKIDKKTFELFSKGRK